jgi:hypothetical protein
VLRQLGRFFVYVLLGIFVTLPSAAEDYKFGAEESLLSGIHVAQPTTARDDLTQPKDVPVLYRNECGSCHVLYPPNLLSDTSGWKEIMDGLHNHFGENAELERLSA